MSEEENKELIEENNLLNKGNEEVESSNSSIPDVPSTYISDPSSPSKELPQDFVLALSGCQITSIKERENSADVHDDLQGLAPSDDEMDEKSEESPITSPVDKELETYFLTLDDVNLYLDNFIKNCHFDTYVFRVQIIQDLASKSDDQQNIKRPILDEILKLFKRSSDNNFTCYEYVCVYHLFNLKINKGVPIPKKIPKFLVNLKRVIPEVKKKMKEIENYQNTINRLEKEIENVKNDKALTENTLLNVTNQYFTSPAVYSSTSSSSSSKQKIRKDLRASPKITIDDDDNISLRPLSTTAKSKKRISFSECDFVFNPDKGTVEKTPPRNSNNNNQSDTNITSPSRVRSVSDTPSKIPPAMTSNTLSTTLTTNRLAAIRQMNGRKKKSPLLMKKNDDNSDDSDSSSSKSPTGKKTKPSLIKKPTKRTVTKKN